MSEDIPKHPYVLSFVGENANGMLRWWTEKILERFLALGFASKLIDLRAPEWKQQLNDCIQAQPPAFCFSFQGMGSTLLVEGKHNLWEQANIPFVSTMGDNPHHAPHLHAAHGPGICYLYCCEDFLDTYRRYLKGKAYTGLLEFGYPENPYADRTPWSQREFDLVYVKTAINPDRLREEWKLAPKIIRQILEESAELLLTGIDETVETVCGKVFTAKSIDWGERLELFLFTCSRVDSYVRAVRAERMVKALLPHKALILGNWQYLDTTGSRARFEGPIASEKLDELFARSKIVVSTLATIRYGLHERILAGFFAKSAVLSDTTAFLQKDLEKCRSFFGLAIDQPTFGEQLDAAVASCLSDRQMPQKIEATWQVANDRFSLDRYARGILEHLEAAAFCRNLSAWQFPPKPAS